MEGFKEFGDTVSNLAIFREPICKYREAVKSGIKSQRSTNDTTQL